MAKPRILPEEAGGLGSLTVRPLTHIETNDRGARLLQLARALAVVPGGRRELMGIDMGHPFVPVDLFADRFRRALGGSVMRGVFKRLNRSAGLVCALCGMIACGGGGSSSPTPVATPTPASAPSFSSDTRPFVLPAGGNPRPTETFVYETGAGVVTASIVFSADPDITLCLCIGGTESCTPSCNVGPRIDWAKDFGLAGSDWPTGVLRVQIYQHGDNPRFPEVPGTLEISYPTP